MNRREFLGATALLPCALKSLATPTSNVTMDILNQAVKEALVPGAAIVASKGGVIRLGAALGTYCRLNDREAPLTLETRHPLYSFSKLITGTVVAIARSEGRLDYSDLVSKHIPEFKGGGKDVITLRQCLTHSAGLNKVESVSVFDAARWNKALEALCAAEVAWPPGSRTVYHGWSGAFLAAECVRRTNGGKPWPEICREKLFAPIGAASLSFDLPQADAPVAIVPQPDALKPLPTTAAAAFAYAGQPGAGCFGTLEDALKVLQLQQGVWESKTLIGKETFRELHTVQYAAEINSARAAGKSPTHEPWGLGPLMRGNGPACDSHRWFGFYNQSSLGIFGHAGIDTLIGVGDLKSGIAFTFATTNSPKPAAKTIELRNKVTDSVFEELR